MSNVKNQDLTKEEKEELPLLLTRPKRNAINNSKIVATESSVKVTAHQLNKKKREVETSAKEAFKKDKKESQSEGALNQYKFPI